MKSERANYNNSDALFYQIERNNKRINKALTRLCNMTPTDYKKLSFLSTMCNRLFKTQPVIQQERNDGKLKEYQKLYKVIQ